MAYEPPHHLASRAIPAGDRTSAAQRLRQPTAAKSRPKIIASKQSETLPAERSATFAVAYLGEPSSELAAKRHSSRRAARSAKEQELAALCHRRASLWADAIREGLDPDIARFVRGQAAAWRLVATSYTRSAKDA
jgi:hypothetical protein